MKLDNNNSPVRGEASFQVSLCLEKSLSSVNPKEGAASSEGYRGVLIKKKSGVLDQLYWEREENSCHVQRRRRERPDTERQK